MQRVQLNLEALLPELRDLENKKIFTKVSINDVAARQTDAATNRQSCKR